MKVGSKSEKKYDEVFLKSHLEEQRDRLQGLHQHWLCSGYAQGRKFCCWELMEGMNVKLTGTYHGNP